MHLLFSSCPKYMGAVHTKPPRPTRFWSLQIMVLQRSDIFLRAVKFRRHEIHGS